MQPCIFLLKPSCTNASWLENSGMRLEYESKLVWPNAYGGRETWGGAGGGTCPPKFLQGAPKMHMRAPFKLPPMENLPEVIFPALLRASALLYHYHFMSLEFQTIFVLIVGHTVIYPSDWHPPVTAAPLKLFGGQLWLAKSSGTKGAPKIYLSAFQITFYPSDWPISSQSCPHRFWELLQPLYSKCREMIS